MRISLCLIVKNEAEVLARCLKSVLSFADEIIIVDTGSTDTTKAIAKQFTDKVFDFEWVSDFSAARNFSFSKATMEYVMWLDADDVVPKKSAEEINDLKKSLDTTFDIVTMKYVLSFDQNGNPSYFSTRERIFKRSNNYQWLDPVHECIPLIGNLHYTNIEIWHKKTKTEQLSTRNIDIYNNLENSGKEFSPRQLYYYARELRDHGKSEKAILYYEKFLESGSGWIEDVISCCHQLAIEYRKTGAEEKVLPTLLKSLECDIPRPEICCEIGYYYKEKGQYNQAFNWFDLATLVPENISIGFVFSDYSHYIPNIEACVCLCFLGNYVKANEYNERAALAKPDCLSVVQNRAYLRPLLNNGVE